MTIPTALDRTLAPPGGHVVGLFVQYAPYQLPWGDPAFTERFVDRVLGIVEEHCPGFRASILGQDVLTPLALEEVFGRLVVEARMKFHQRKYDEALQVFKHCLAVAEKTTTKGKHAEYGALMHNIASCLHCLGDFPAAKVRTRAWLRR